MAIYEKLLVTVPDTSEIESLSITEGFGQTTAIAVVTCGTTDLVMNDLISITAGFESGNDTLLTGRVKEVRRTYPDNQLQITVKDILIDAVDYFLVSDNPETPFSRENISAPDLVHQLLQEAGISNAFNDQVPLSFTFGTVSPAEFNLISAWDAVHQVSSILSWHVYANAGQLYFADIKPYFRTGAQKDTEYGTGGNSDDTVSHAFCNDGSMTQTALDALALGLTLKTSMTSLERRFSDEGIRNKIVVYGHNNLTAIASAASAYLPAGFFKSAVIASDLIDLQDMADSAAAFNLGILNRLTQSMTLEVLGDIGVKARQFVIVSDSYVGTDIDDRWFVEDVAHNFGKDGYLTTLTLRA